jgi:hypothetical protein
LPVPTADRAAAVAAALVLRGERGYLAKATTAVLESTQAAEVVALALQGVRSPVLLVALEALDQIPTQRGQLQLRLE